MLNRTCKGLSASQSAWYCLIPVHWSMYSLLTNDNHSMGIRIIELFMYEIIQHVHEFTMKGEGSPAINSRWWDSESCKNLGMISWYMIWFLLIPDYQIRIYIPYDNVLWMCTKVYRNNSENLIPDSRILLVISLDSWSQQCDSKLWRPINESVLFDTFWVLPIWLVSCHKIIFTDANTDWCNQGRGCTVYIITFKWKYFNKVGCQEILKIKCSKKGGV